MKYKLLVLDVDGTLLNEEKAISKRTLSALLKVQQMGVRIVLASGRPTYGLMSIAKTLELGLYGGFILSYNGCQIIDARNGQVLFERRINPEMLPYIEKKAVKNNFALFTYHDNTLLTNTPDNTHVKEEAELNGLEIIEESEFSTAIDFAPCKCMLVSDDADALIGLESHWKKRLDGVLNVFRSEDYFLEVVPCSVDKANTLAVLMEQLGVTRDEVMAIGDGVCDVAMIQLAGMGVAMGNSVDSVKICADYTTDTNENDGVAQAILPLLPSIIQSSRIAPSSESTVNNFPFGTFPVNLRFPVADTYLYVSPCLDVCPVQVLLNAVQRLVHGLQYHKQVAGRAGRCARGIQHEVAHRLIEVFSLVGDVPYCFFIDSQYQCV